MGTCIFLLSRTNTTKNVTRLTIQQKKIGWGSPIPAKREAIAGKTNQITRAPMAMSRVHVAWDRLHSRGAYRHLGRPE